MSILLSIALSLAAGDGELSAGFASADITPEIGASIPGGFRPNLVASRRDLSELEHP